MAELTDFDCEDCGARAGAPCVYMMPPGPPYQIAFVMNRRKGYSWKYVTIPWSGVRPYTEDVKSCVASYRYLAESPQQLDDIELGMPKKFRKVGTPLEKIPGHTARVRAKYAWEKQAERLAMQEYLRSWLQEFGSIFEETK